MRRAASSLTVRVLVALAAGLIIGTLVDRSGNRPLLTAAAIIEPIGTLWINAIRMTVIPLVVSVLVTGVANVGDARSISRLGVRAIALFFGLLILVGILTALFARPLLAGLELDPAATERLRASATEIPAGISASASAREFVLGLIPSNAIRAAADTAMLGVFVTTLLFALAITRITPESRAAVLRFAQGVREATFVVVGWILAVAPIGVFALAVTLAVTLGVSAMGAIGYYVTLIVVLHVIGTALLYPLASYVGRVPLSRFAKRSHRRRRSPSARAHPWRRFPH